MNPEPVFFREGSPSGTWRSHQGPAERSAADQSASWIRFLPAGAGCLRCFREGTAALLYYPSLPGGLASSSCQNKPSRKKTNKQLMTFSRKSSAASPAGGETNAAEARVSQVVYSSSTLRAPVLHVRTQRPGQRGTESPQWPTSSAPRITPCEI